MRGLEGVAADPVAGGVELAFALQPAGGVMVGQLDLVDPALVSGPGPALDAGAPELPGLAGLPGADLQRLAREQRDGDLVRRLESAAAGEIRQFVAQWETLEAERRDLARQQAEVMAEAKARGYSTRALREVIRLRRMRPEERAEFEAVVEMYRAALDL